MLPNFNIQPIGKVSQAFLDKGITTFYAATDYVKQLPYSRNSNKHDFTIILKENCGTCSSKHAALAQLAIENNQPEIQLMVGIYKMNETNTKGTGDILTTNNLAFIPEAHNYLMHQGKRYDYTGLVLGEVSPMDSLLYEEVILPQQITDYKVNLHKSYIKGMVSEGSLKTNLTLKKLWDIRELCIKTIGNHEKIVHF